MVRILFSIISAILVLGAHAAQGGEKTVYQEINAKRDWMIHRIQHRSGVTVGDLFVEPDSDKEGSYQITVFDRGRVYRAEVVIADVGHDNVDDKLKEAVEVLVSDLKEKREGIYVGEVFLGETINSDEWSPSFDNGIGVVGAYPVYFSVWVQLPGIDGGEVDMLGMHGRSRWMRTSFNYEGRLDGPNDKAVWVGKVATTIWEMEQRTPEMLRVVRIGTIEGNIRHQAAGDPVMGRLDLDIVRITTGKAYPAGATVRFFYNASIRLGVRIIDENETNFRIVFGKSIQLGLLIANKFFIAGKLDSESDYFSNSYLTLGLDVGWSISSLITLKAGVTYRADEENSYGADEMYLVPEGWSFNLGLFMKF